MAVPRINITQFEAIFLATRTDLTFVRKQDVALAEFGDGKSDINHGTLNQIYRKLGPNNSKY